MKKLISFIIGLLFITISALSVGVNTSMAQENLFDSLDSIKAGLQEIKCENDEKCGPGNTCEKETPLDSKGICVDGSGESVGEIKIKDYSETEWGNLENNASFSQSTLELTKLEFTSIDAMRSSFLQWVEDESPVTVCSRDDEGEKIDSNCTDMGDFFESKGLEYNNDEVNIAMAEIQYKGESQLNAIITEVANVMRNILGAFAILWIVIAGIMLVMAHGDESKITEQKQSLTYAVIGLVIVLLLERMVVLIYGAPGITRDIAQQSDIEAISTEILGVVSFMKAIIGSIAIFMIIIAGFETVTAQGEEEKITKQRKAIMYVIIGIVVILINEIVINNLYIDPSRSADGNITQTGVTNVINLFGTVTQFILGFVGLVAFAALIYGAGTMVSNYGNDEQVEKSKKIIKNALIGIMIIISAFAIVSTVIKFQ